MDKLELNDLLFTTKINTPMTPNNFRNKHHNRLYKEFVAEYTQWANEPFLNLHLLRAFFQAKMSQAGMNAMTIAKLMGHKSVNTIFQHYYCDFEDEKPEEIIITISMFHQLPYNT